MDISTEAALRPRIAVTTTTGRAGGRKLPHVLLNAQYVEAVERPGATAVLLSPLHAAASVEAVLDVVHGLVLTGGEDVNPARYGQEPHPALGTVNDARDAMEMAALAGALQRGMPVFAICRGMQLLNVALGGTLFQDLPNQLDGDLLHEQTAPIDERWHGARIRTDSRLGEVMGMEQLRINSFHHQGVDRLAPGLQASVWAEDGLVEGVESTEHPWVMGVQWHPERGEAEAWHDPRDPNRRLFWAFAEAAREWSAAHAVRGL